jgi:CpeS-like protein
VTLCQQLNVDSSLALCGLRLRWSEVAEAYESKFKKKDEGSAVLVAIAAHQKSDASENSSAGRILRSINCANAAMGTFSIGLDEALTLRLEKAGTVSEERIWFASPNLRLRSSSIKKEDLVCITTFCSEIRMAAPAAAPSAETSTSQANAAN